MERCFTVDGESDSIPRIGWVIGNHDIRRFHPDKKDLSIFDMADIGEVVIGAIYRGIGLWIN
jgi:hypothetical protein